MKHLLTFFAVLSISALQAQSNTFNLTDTVLTINSTYTIPTDDLYNACSNRFYSEKADSLKFFLRSHPTIHIQIEWHTEQRGSAEYSKKLTARYAEKFKNFLTEDSTISTERITAVGYGETGLLFDDASIACLNTSKEKETAYYRNRRVVIRIIKL